MRLGARLGEIAVGGAVPSTRLGAVGAVGQLSRRVQGMPAYSIRKILLGRLAVRWPANLVTIDIVRLLQDAAQPALGGVDVQ